MTAIISYGVPEGSKLEFPIKKKEELDISQNTFLALKSLFTLLDGVFRGAGNPCIPQKHSTVAAHKLGLVNLGKTEIFDKLRDLHGLDPLFQQTEREFNLMALIHDTPEVIGEISTFTNRLSKEIGGIGEDDRHNLKKQVAHIIFYLALKANKEKNPHILSEPVLKMQTEMPKQKDQYAKYKYAKKEFVDKLLKQSMSELGNDQELQADHTALLSAYMKMDKDSELENPKIDNFSGIMTKLLDKLESVHYVSHNEVGNYSNPENNKVQLGAFNSPKKLFEKLNSIPGLDNLYRDLIDAIKDFHNRCVKQFKSRSASFNGFQEL